MKIDRLLAFTRQPELLREDETQDLEELVKEYPYFTTAQWLLTLKYKSQNSSRFNRQLQKTAVYAPDQQHLTLALHEELQQLLTLSTHPDEQPETAATRDTGEATGVNFSFNQGQNSLSEPETLAEETPAESEMTAETFWEPENNPAKESAILPEKPGFEPLRLPSEAPEVEEMETEDIGAAAAGNEPETGVISGLAEAGSAANMLPESDQATGAGEDRLGEIQPEIVGEKVVSETEVVTSPADTDTFLQTAHDRLSWFRFYAGKPLREQPDDVLEELYLEHMSGDLLQAEPATMEELRNDLKAIINHDTEVGRDKEIEAEIRRLAYESISDEELPASETLAGIYESQKDYKKALRIYQKLMLKFPDRMTYFAGLVANTKAKLNN